MSIKFLMQVPTDWTLLTVVLAWIVQGGGIYLSGKLFAYVAESWTKWPVLPPIVKWVAPLLFSILLAIGGTLLLEQTAFLAMLQPWYALVAQVVIGYVGSQKTFYQELKPLRMAAKNSKSKT